MGLTRRQLLQRTGLGLLTIGISQTSLDRYTQMLAASTPRKLALLIGIDHYGEDSNSDLKGCITDVERQRELLIHRFGFNSSDILTLTGQKASRESIETAFVEHLINQAQSGDIVIFHFSGYGSQVKLSATEPGLKSFLPSDGIIASQKIPALNDILEETLCGLARSLATDQLTLILDTSHYSNGQFWAGNLRVRSFPIPSEAINPDELAFKEQLQQKNINNKKRPFPGILLRATRHNQIATEITGNGWSSGLFTYALTQYLWQITPASQVLIALGQASEQVAQVMGQQQQPQGLTNEKRSRLTYYQMPEKLLGGEGVITKLEDDKVAEIQLTGLPALILDTYGLNSCFSTESETVLQISSRQGFSAKVQRLGTVNPEHPLEIGQILQEKVRILPRNPGLTVALDSSLSRIERVDATSAFATIPLVNVVANVGEQQADCLLSRIVTDTAEEGYGLLSSGGTLIPNSVGVANEAVKSAVKRLIPQLNKLLALKLWRLTSNEGSSRLKVSARLEKLAQTPQIIRQKDTRLTLMAFCGQKKESTDLANLSTCKLSPPVLNEMAINAPEERNNLTKLSIGTEIHYKIFNYEERPLYCLIFGRDTISNVIALCPSQESPRQLLSYLIEPGKSLLIPQVTSSMRVTNPVGLAEFWLIFSVSPFKQTLAALSANQTTKNELESMLTLSDPLTVAQALWQDLHLASSSQSQTLNNPLETCVMDVDTWATLSFLYQVTE